MVVMTLSPDGVSPSLLLRTVPTALAPLLTGAGPMRSRDYHRAGKVRSPGLFSRQPRRTASNSGASVEVIAKR
jgi:hypothetical protein